MIVRRRTDGTTLSTRVGYGLSGLVGAAIVAVGARFLARPQTAAAGYGLASARGVSGDDPYLSAKGVRDLASGVVTFVLLATGRPRVLGSYMLAMSIIPIGDAAIVLRHGGPRATAFGIHGATAVVMLATAALLLRQPE
jgi:hypothetical protein